MLITPGAVREPVNTERDPSGCGTTAATTRLTSESSGTCCCPVGVQYVSVSFTVTVPFGERDQDCEAVPPSEVVAVMVKLLGTRDCDAEGVQDRLLPPREAPAGAADSEKLTLPPAGSVAVTAYE